MLKIQASPETIQDKKLQGDLHTASIWMALAVGSLILAGLLALVLVIGRAPVVNQLISDPQWAKKCLVIHVNLALGVWFYAFFASLFLLIPSHKNGNVSWILALLGIVLFAGVGFFLSAKPVLANYLPVLNDRLFLAGLLIFYVAVALSFVGPRLLPAKQRVESLLLPVAQMGLKTGAWAFFFALGTLLVTLWMTPTTFNTRSYYETVFWGGGHLFQFVNVIAMTSVWLILLSRVLKTSPVSQKTGAVFFGLLLLPVLISPVFMVNGVNSPRYHDGFTLLMRWGIWPPVILLLGVLGAAFYRGFRKGLIHREDLQTPFFTGWLFSCLLTLVGFGLGSMISRSSTLIPAHYHAAIGAVTVAFMAMSYILMERFQKPLPTAKLKRLATYQPALFGSGQLIFALGFAYAGLHGLGRKVYGSEQHIRTVEEYIGLAIMGVGGLLAILGGILFLVLLGKCWFQKKSI